MRSWQVLGGQDSSLTLWLACLVQKKRKQVLCYGNQGKGGQAEMRGRGGGKNCDANGQCSCLELSHLVLRNVVNEVPASICVLKRWSLLCDVI